MRPWAVLVLLAAGCQEDQAISESDAPADAGPPLRDAVDAGAGDAYASDAPARDAGNSQEASTRGQLGAPASDVVAAAKTAYLIRFARDIPGNAYTNAGNTGGASIILAFAALAGDMSADARLLEQMRFTLKGGNDICANGGYPGQHELFVTGMFAVAKTIPRIWPQLTTGERDRVDALMEASLVGNAFTTSDNNPFVRAGTQEYTLDGDSNIDRDWNPNYREGMGGSILVATAYFGGGAAAGALLRGYVHDALVARLDTLGLTNAYEIFNWKAAHPASSAPTGAQIEAAVHDWALHGVPIEQWMTLAAHLSDNTYGKPVACGVNGGAGLMVTGGAHAGVIDTGCSGLPNLGVPGMLLEFDSNDAEGVRSSAEYAYGGHKANLITHAVLLATGLWTPGGTADEIVKRTNVGTTDLWYKLDHGYRDYEHGASAGILRSDDPGFGFRYLRSLWNDVVRPYHRL